MKYFGFFILIVLFNLSFTKSALSEASLQLETTEDQWAFDRLIGAEQWLKTLEEQRSRHTGQDLPPHQEELMLKIQYELARRYYEMGNFKETFSFLIEAAGGGYAPAEFSLYRMFFLGENINQDIQKAFSSLAEESGPGIRSTIKSWSHWLDKAAKQGLLIALHYKALERLKVGCSIEMDENLDNFQYQIRARENCFKKAFAYFELLAEQAYAPSLYYLALMYLRAEGTEKDTDKALQLLEVAAEQGHIHAQEILEQGLDEAQQAQSEWHIYEYEEANEFVFLNLPRSQVMENILEGKDLNALNLERVEPGFKEPGYKILEQTGREWIKIASEDQKESDSIKKALEEDLNEVQYRTLIIHTLGNANPWRALKKLQRRAYLDYHLDQYDLALRHYKGDGVERNVEMAFYWFSKAAEQEGYAPAEYALSFLLEELAELEEDGSKTKQYLLDRSLERLIKAAEQAYAPAQYKLAHKYEEENPELSFQLLEAAADQDYPSALYELYFKFLEKGNHPSAIYSLTRASKQGLLFAEYELAYEHREKDPERFLQLLEEVAERGLAFAYCQLYFEYLERENDEQAISYLKEASRQGLPLAQYTLAKEYDRGERVKKDPHEAVYWFIEAAKQAYAPAQYKLYFKFALGEGTHSSTEIALHWLKRSAEQGHAPAQYQLAILYDEGRMVDKKSPSEAVHLFIKAEKQGYDPALLRLIDIVCGNYEVEEDIFNIVVDWLKERKKEEVINYCSEDHLRKNGLVVGSVGLFAAVGAEQAYASIEEVVSHTEEGSAVHPGESTSGVSAVSDSQISEATVKSTSQTAFEESAEALPQTAEAASELSAEMVTEVGASIVGEIAADLALDWIPVVGFGKLGFEAIAGTHLLTGRDLTPFERAASGGGAVLNLIGFGWLKNLKSLKHSKAVGQQAHKWVSTGINGEQWAKLVRFVKEGQIERARGYLKSFVQSIGDIGFKIKRRVTTRRKVLAAGGSSVDEASETVVVNMEEGLGVPGRLESDKLSRAVDPDKMSNPGQSKVYRTGDVGQVPAARDGVFVRTQRGDQPLDYNNPEVLGWLRQAEIPQRQAVESLINKGAGKATGNPSTVPPSLIKRGGKDPSGVTDFDLVLH